MRSLIPILAATALACSDTLTFAPGGVLVGEWTDGQFFPTNVAATRAGATLSTPCIRVTFGPVRLDQSLAFHVVGVANLGSSQAFPDTLTGHVVEDRFVIGEDRLVIGQDTLRPGPPTAPGAHFMCARHV